MYLYLGTCLVYNLSLLRVNQIVWSALKYLCTEPLKVKRVKWKDWEVYYREFLLNLRNKYKNLWLNFQYQNQSICHFQDNSFLSTCWRNFWGFWNSLFFLLCFSKVKYQTMIFSNYENFDVKLCNVLEDNFLFGAILSITAMTFLTKVS